MTLCELGVSLSKGAKQYLRKKKHQRLMQFILKYPEFRVDGPKGRELISYLPAPSPGGQSGSDSPARTSAPGGSDSCDSPAVEPEAVGDSPAVECETVGDSPAVECKTVVTLAPAPRYWCPACRQAFVRWSQCRQHILVKNVGNTCRATIDLVNGGKDEMALQERCRTLRVFQ